MDQNILMNLDEAMKESLEKIFQLLEEKKYFLAKDELLKYNDADIAGNVRGTAGKAGTDRKDGRCVSSAAKGCFGRGVFLPAVG